MRAKTAENIPHAGSLTEPRRLAAGYGGIILGNLVYILNVLFWSQDVFGVLVLFWVENSILGIFALFRALLAQQTTILFRLKAAVFLVVALCLQQIVFGTASIVFFSDDFVEGDREGAHRIILDLATDPWVILSAIALFVIQTTDFVKRYLIGGGRKTATAEWQLRHVMIKMPLMIAALMVGAVVMHESPLFDTAGRALAGLLLLIAVKAAIEAYFAWQEKPAAVG